MNHSSDNTTASSNEKISKSSGKKLKVFLPLLILALPFFILWSSENEEVLSTSAEEITRPVVQESIDEKYRKLIVGHWEMDRNGKRLLTVNPDGTAVIDAEVSSNWSLLFGKKLKFDIEWSIDNGILTMKTIGGEPQGKVDLIVSMYGADRVQPIKILNETTLQLPDDEPEEEDHIWTRLETP